MVAGGGTRTHNPLRGAVLALSACSLSLSVLACQRRNYWAFVSLCVRPCSLLLAWVGVMSRQPWRLPLLVGHSTHAVDPAAAFTCPSAKPQRPPCTRDDLVRPFAKTALNLLCQSGEEALKTRKEHTHGATLVIPIDNLPHHTACCWDQIQTRVIAGAICAEGNPATMPPDGLDRAWLPSHTPRLVRGNSRALPAPSPPPAATLRGPATSPRSP